MAGEEDLDAEFALFEQEIAAAETEAVEDDSAAAAAPAAAPAAAAAKPAVAAAAKPADVPKPVETPKPIEIKGPVDRRKVFSSAPVSNVEEEEAYKPEPSKAATMPTWAQPGATATKPGFTPAFAPPVMQPPPATATSAAAPAAPAAKQPVVSAPAAPAPPPPAYAPPAAKKEAKKDEKWMRTAGGKKWEDASLADWPKDDFRMFCGNLGNEVDDSVLARSFGKFPSFQKAKIVRDGRTKKPKGYGFVSFSDPADFTKALREMQGVYVGNRPIKVMRSEYEERSMQSGNPKNKKKQRVAHSMV